MIGTLKTFWKLLKKTYSSWVKNEPYGRSGTIAYYSLFSLPSLLVIVISIAGYFFEQEAVQGRITYEIGGLIGMEAAKAIEEMIANVVLSEKSTLALILGTGILLFGATGVFFQLKLAMNNIWNVAEKKTDFLHLLLDRVISFGMVLVVGLLLLVSLVISAILSVLSDEIQAYAPQLTEMILDIANFLISFLVISTLFTAVFKLLPDIRIRWKVTYVGATLTTVLFLIGEFVIGFFLGQSKLASVYGGASSMVLILLWVYYICLILFFGVEFTKQYALGIGEKVKPNKKGEPAIYQELEKLNEKRLHSKDEKQIMQKLRSSLGWESDTKSESE